MTSFGITIKVKVKFNYSLVLLRLANSHLRYDVIY